MTLQDPGESTWDTGETLKKIIKKITKAAKMLHIGLAASHIQVNPL